MDTQAACPFHNSSICRTNFSNIHLDSGYIDLNKDLGVNAPEDQNIHFRTVLQCAPLETEGYTESVVGLRDNYTTYNYGPFDNVDYTYMIEDLDMQYNIQDENMLRGTANTFLVK